MSRVEFLVFEKAKKKGGGRSYTLDISVSRKPDSAEKET